MWFEGETTPDKLPDTLVRHLREARDDQGLLWTEQSSNVGTTVNDDGYVFHSTGSTGRDSIYIGFKNAYHEAANWHKGHRFFVTDRYVPNNTPGVNGEWGDTLTEGFRCHYDNGSWGSIGVTGATQHLRYMVSITRDRVIVCIRTSHLGHSIAAHLRNLLYMGLIKRYSDEPDTSALTVATLYPIVNENAASSVRLLRNGAKEFGKPYKVWNGNHMPYQGRYGFDRRFPAFTLPLANNNEGLRGELDGLLQASWGEDKFYGRTLPEEGWVTIDGREYFSLLRVQSHWGVNDNLAPYDNQSYCYLIAKV